MKSLKLLACTLLFLLSCDRFEYSPNQMFDADTPRDLNSKNIAALQSRPVDDTVTIAFVGDSQRFYDEVDEFVAKVNTIPSIDFTLLAGDITDFGLLTEYEWIHESLARLNAPYIGVIGNHDVIANGEDVYRRMYGPLNFSFIYDSIKFIIHNTNGREYSRPVPDMKWLESEFNDDSSGAVKHIIPVSHIQPGHGDFNQELTAPYSQLLASTPELLVSLHGHIHDHSDGYLFNDGVRYITSFAFNQKSFVVLKIVNGQVIKQIINY